MFPKCFLDARKITTLREHSAKYCVPAGLSLYRSNLKYSVPKKIHSGCNYDYHFIIKEIAEKF